MKALRFFALFAMTLALTFASFGIASAEVLTLTPVSVPTSVAHDAGSFNVVFNVTYTGVDTDLATVSFTGTITSGHTTGTITFTPAVQLSANQSAIVTATIPFSALQSGTIAGNIKATRLTGTSNELGFSVPITGTPRLYLTKQTELGLNQNGTFVVTSTGAPGLGTVTFTSSNAGVSFDPLSLPSVPAGTTSSPIKVSITDLTKFSFGPNTVTVTATAGADKATTDFTFNKGFCNNGEAGSNLSISSVTIRNTGDDDLIWNPLDEMTIKVDVDNNGQSDLREVYVKMGLFDSSGSNKVGQLDFTGSDDEEISMGTINDGGTEKATFEFKMPVDFKEGSYKLALKAYSKRTGESVDCTDQPTNFSGAEKKYEPISVEKRTDNNELIAVTNFQIPDQNVCGSTISGSFDVANVGDTDEDRILIRMIGTTLGLDQEFELLEDLDSGDDPRTVNFDFKLPTDIQDGTHRIFFRASYDYRNNGYHLTSKEYEEVVKVIGCTGITGGNTQNAAITATLGSDAKAGEKLVVNAVVRNLGNTQKSFVIDARGYQSWATLESISDRIVTLGAGESRSIAIVLNVDSTAAASQEFTIEALADGQTTSQIVDVRLAEATGGLNLSGNWLIWAIGAVNLVLIILIIVVAVRVSRR